MYTSYHKNLVQLTIGNDAFVIGVSKSGKPYQVANVEALDQFIDKSGCPPDTGLIHYREVKVSNKLSITFNHRPNQASIYLYRISGILLGTST